MRKQGTGQFISGDGSQVCVSIIYNQLNVNISANAYNYI